MNSQLPLYVDLDGTLLKSDTLVEGMARMLLKNPLMIFMIVLWLAMGRARLKLEVSRRVPLAPETLPWNEDFVLYLKGAHQGGRTLYLATASAEIYARQMAGHFGLFSGVLCSDKENNLRGTAKKDAILAHNQSRAFAYAGNSWDDTKIWDTAEEIIMVHASKSLQDHVQKDAKFKGKCMVFEDKASCVTVWARVTDLRMWLLNFPVWTPLLVEGRHFKTEMSVKLFILYMVMVAGSMSAGILSDFLKLGKASQPVDQNENIFTAAPANPFKILGSGMGLLAVALLLTMALDAKLAAVPLLLIMFSYVSLLLFHKPFMRTICYNMGSLMVSMAAGVLLMGQNPNSYLLCTIVIFGSSMIILDATRHEKSRNGRDFKHHGIHGTQVPFYFGFIIGYLSVLAWILYIKSSDCSDAYSKPEFLSLVGLAMFAWNRKIWHSFKKHMDSGTEKRMGFGKTKAFLLLLGLTGLGLAI